MSKIDIKQKIIGKIAEYMVKKNADSPVIAEVKKPLNKSRIAFITTSGVHLKEDLPFDTNGDYSYRTIPKDVDFKDLTITHTHYDTTEAMKDKNVVFPLEILQKLSEEKYIKDISPRHFSFMGYIPEIEKLINISSKEIADKLVEDNVDIVLLSPGWYLCHQSVGLIQREIESRGIRTASIMHLPKVGVKVRPPRIMHIIAPLGRTFSNAYDIENQISIVKELLEFSLDGKDEEIRKTKFKYSK